MASYKVLQDIEAEDKLLGPLTLRQFIYASIVVVVGFIAFQVALVNWLVALIFLPVILFFALLAFPFGKDQPTEVWLLAKIRFFLKPRRRIWDQSGVKELVTITAPKKVEQVRTKDYTQHEFKSRLQALANTIDSRGWAVKNVSVNLFAQPAYATDAGSSDRLINTADLPREVSGLDIQDSDDMLDERNNPTAQNLDRLINASSTAHRQQIVQRMNGQTAAPQSGQQAAPDYWFMNQNLSAPTPPGYTTARSTVVTPGARPADPTPKRPAPDEQTLLKQIQDKKDKPKIAYGNMKTIQPLGDKNPDEPAQDKPAPSPDPVTADLALNSDHLYVDTIARQANKRKQPPEDEVVISLH